MGLMIVRARNRRYVRPAESTDAPGCGPDPTPGRRPDSAPGCGPDPAPGCGPDPVPGWRPDPAPGCGPDPAPADGSTAPDRASSRRRTPRPRVAISTSAPTESQPSSVWIGL